VVEIHPDDLDRAATVLESLPDAAIDTRSIQDVEMAFAAADIRCNWCY
jgi:hypothetical protein